MIFKKTQIFIFSLFAISFILLIWNKTNIINTENFNKNIIQENNILSSVSINLDTLDIKFNNKSNLFFISLEAEQVINKEFYIESNNKKYDLELDLDNNFSNPSPVLPLDKGRELKNKIYFKPVFLKDTTNIKIIVKNKSSLNKIILNSKEENKNILNTIEVTALNLDKKEFNSNYIRDVFKLRKVKALWSTIVSREEWGANPELIYRDSDIWKKKLWTYSSTSSSGNSWINNNILTPYQKKQKRIREIFWNDNYDYTKSSKVEYYESWRKLLWAREYMDSPNKIVVHHTASIYDKDRSDEDIVRWIYYFHSITRQWWDIWYNYLVGRDWTIYEWRWWWELVIWAHAKWNNRRSIWISLLWDFEQEEANSEQIKWLIYLISDLSLEYNINLEWESIAFRECNSENCTEPLDTFYTSNLVWHRDIWHTSCPGENVYELLDNIKSKVNNFDPELLEEFLKEKEKKNQEYNLLKEFKETLDNEKIKIKLGYESRYWNNNIITIKPLVHNSKLRLSFIKNNKTLKSREISKELKFSIKDDKVALHLWKYIIPISKQLKISWDILEIKSWYRKPTWDKKNKYNDNKFRWNILLINLDWKLVVINELDLHSYLKWLWEVWNRDNSEKSKAIIISARTYAKYYLDKNNRKFNTDLYDWSDNPDEFQKYLWYEFEKRTNSVSKLVNETRWEVIKYNWNIIKPWYFSSSNWQTKSYLDYCKSKWWWNKCKDIPYLQSVIDEWSKWLEFKWHWVWLSGTWAEFLARQWKDYKEILEYFYTWVSVELEKELILSLESRKNIKDNIWIIDKVQRDLFEM